MERRRKEASVAACAKAKMERVRKKGEGRGSSAAFIEGGWEQKGSNGGRGGRPTINGHGQRLQSIQGRG
jgi:hypothetical protein